MFESSEANVEILKLKQTMKRLFGPYEQYADFKIVRSNSPSRYDNAFDVKVIKKRTKWYHYLMPRTSMRMLIGGTDLNKAADIMDAINSKLSNMNAEENMKKDYHEVIEWLMSTTKVDEILKKI